MPDKTPVVMTNLPRAVLDRIHRYAEEGRVPQVRYEHDHCYLLAVSKWQPAAVLLRSNRAQFTGMRAAALTEWARATRSRRKLA